MAPEVVTIHYRRLPDRVQIFEQLEIDADSERVVTLLESAALKGPVMAGDQVVLEPGAPVVWFTYPGRRHDIGRFHLADGSFTGFYANVITPVIMNGRTWHTTDLCLDVWLGADGELLILDEEELQEAVTNRWIDPAAAELVRVEAQRLVAQAEVGEWPPPHVHEWTLEKARMRLAELSAAEKDR